MLGLAVLFFIGLYLLITLAAVWFAARWARKRGRRSWVWGGVAALVMYHLMFWDLIPALLLHKYYCSTEAGFWVYKTPEQWVEENLEGSGECSATAHSEIAPVSMETKRIVLTNRFFKEVRHSSIFPSLGRSEEILYDGKTGEQIAKSIQFVLGDEIASAVSGGEFGAIRRAFVFSWFSTRQCGVSGKKSVDGVSPTYREFSLFVLEFLKQGEAK
jgi:hypothetical protein